MAVGPTLDCGGEELFAKRMAATQLYPRCEGNADESGARVCAAKGR
uniref:Uncharacterized protein n=1 Tax=Anopheles arabiensis TaxID=7173 RepID=A0A182HK74_ANOAR